MAPLEGKPSSVVVDDRSPTPRYVHHGIYGHSRTNSLTAVGTQRNLTRRPPCFACCLFRSIQQRSTLEKLAGFHISQLR